MDHVGRPLWNLFGCKIETSLEFIEGVSPVYVHELFVDSVDCLIMAGEDNLLAKVANPLSQPKTAHGRSRLRTGKQLSPPGRGREGRSSPGVGQISAQGFQAILNFRNRDASGIGFVLDGHSGSHPGGLPPATNTSTLCRIGNCR